MSTKLDDKYIISGPEMEVTVDWLRRKHADGYHTEHYLARVHWFSLTYYSDYMDDDDEPFEGALCDSEANVAARAMLDQYVAENVEYTNGAVVVSDQHVDGAETHASSRVHENEYTVFYEVVEDLGEVCPSTEALIEAKAAEKRAVARLRMQPAPAGSLANPGPLSTFLSDVAVGLGSRDRVSFKSERSVH